MKLHTLDTIHGQVRTRFIFVMINDTIMNFELLYETISLAQTREKDVEPLAYPNRILARFTAA